MLFKRTFTKRKKNEFSLLSHKQTPQFDELNDYSINTSGFTYKQNDYDITDLSIANVNCDNHIKEVIIGKKILILQEYDFSNKENRV